MAKNLTGRPMDNLLLSEVSDPVGTIAQSELSEIEYNDENLGLWFALDGRSSAGTLYATKSGNANVPDATNEGAFLRQAHDGRTPGTPQSHAVQTHQHMSLAWTNSGGSFGGAGPAYGAGANAHGVSTKNFYSAQTDAAETRPSNVAVNFYIKVDY